MIIYNAGRIKTYENVKALVKLIGEDEQFAEDIWQGMYNDDELIEEFNYFVQNKSLRGNAKCGDISLIDLYFSQMNKYNLYHDLGKNPVDCLKERMVIEAFKELIDMRKNPNYMTDYENIELKGVDIL